MSLLNVTNMINGFSLSQAMWGPHLLMPAGGKLSIVSSGIWDGYLLMSSELEVEQLESTEAQNPLNVKGGDKPIEFAIQVEVSKMGTGSDPIVVSKQWKRSLGKSYFFFVGALPLSTSQYILKSVELYYGYDDTASDGSPLRCTLALEFTEDTVLAVAQKKQEEEKSSDGASKAAKKASPKAQGDGFDLKQFIQSNNL